MVAGKRNKTIDAMKALSTIMVVYIHSHNIVNYAGMENKNTVIQLVSGLSIDGSRRSSLFLDFGVPNEKKCKVLRRKYKEKGKNTTVAISVVDIDIFDARGGG